MKNSFLIICYLFGAFLFSPVYSSAQELDVPEEVQGAFEEKFPAVTDVFWAADGIEYQAEFIYIDYGVKAIFLEDGAWQQTVTAIELEDLPNPAKEYLTAEYIVDSFRHIDKIEVPNLLQYFVVIEVKDKTYILNFDEKGKLINKEIEDF